METNAPDGIPRGIEALLKWASVDPAFLEEFLADPVAAAKRSGLVLTPAEVEMLRDSPKEHLAAIVNSTTATEAERKILVGRDGAQAFEKHLRAPAPSRGDPKRMPVLVTGIRPGLPYPLPLPLHPCLVTLVNLFLLAALFVALVYLAIRWWS
jgi:hypothetical protein